MWWNRGRKAESSEALLNRLKVLVSKAPPAQYANGSQREARASRNTVFKQGVAILPHGEKVPVVIKDLSPTGCRIEYFQNRPLEGRLTITEPSVPLHRRADVVWIRDGASGLRFVDETATSEGETGGGF